MPGDEITERTERLTIDNPDDGEIGRLYNVWRAPSGAWVCNECGALVHVPSTHDLWHDRMNGREDD